MREGEGRRGVKVRREKGEGRREREKGEGRREKGEGRREKGGRRRIRKREEGVGKEKNQNYPAVSLSFLFFLLTKFPGRAFGRR
jgi:hypothetical protein